RFLFFFSSRRRHTRFSRDWSSDVCSSDLEPETAEDERACPLDIHAVRWDAARGELTREREGGGATADEPFADDVLWERPILAPKIGRASCRERGYSAVGAVSVQAN